MKKKSNDIITHFKYAIYLPNKGYLTKNKTYTTNILEANLINLIEKIPSQHKTILITILEFNDEELYND